VRPHRSLGHLTPAAYAAACAGSTAGWGACSARLGARGNRSKNWTVSHYPCSGFGGPVRARSVRRRSRRRRGRGPFTARPNGGSAPPASCGRSPDRSRESFGPARAWTSTRGLDRDTAFDYAWDIRPVWENSPPRTGRPCKISLEFVHQRSRYGWHAVCVAG
jgi:hypothetical protein